MEIYLNYSIDKYMYIHKFSYDPLLNKPSTAVHQFAPYTMNTNWAWMASQASGQNPFASQPPANNNPIITPNNHNNPFL